MRHWPRCTATSSWSGQRPLRRLKAGLSAYAVNRAAGPPPARFAETTWNQHVSVLSCFYQWAVAEGHASAVPFSYAQAIVSYADNARTVQVNLARRRAPRPHVTIKYLEREFAELFVKGLRGLTPDGLEDRSFRGRDLVRNAAVGGLALDPPRQPSKATPVSELRHKHRRSPALQTRHHGRSSQRPAR
jgi:hypothetical protein